jgi:release factor glutamine methyltransferase
MNVGDLYTYAQDLFQTAQKQNYTGDIKKLISHILIVNNPEELPLLKEQQITDNQFTKCKELLQRRLNDEPIAYIIGKKAFWKHDFLVNKAVLIPRPETELIIETALTKFNRHKKLKILDLGTGSGCLAISLKHEFSNAEVIGIDISKSALAVAQQNIKNLQQKKIKLLHGDWFSPLKNSEKFDLIVSNPPYIDINDWEKLENNVAKFEPKGALTDYNNGLKHYQHIITHAPNYLRKASTLLLEIGFNQQNEVCKILKNNNFKFQVHLDLNKVPRMIEAEIQ